jgi:hypothetical protein
MPWVGWVSTREGREIIQNFLGRKGLAMESDDEIQAGCLEKDSLAALCERIRVHPVHRFPNEWVIKGRSSPLQEERL